MRVRPGLGAERVRALGLWGAPGSAAGTFAEHIRPLTDAFEACLASRELDLLDWN